MKLTPTQEAAVRTSGKNLLVSAGAGTGKTRVLVERFLHFVAGGQALVTEILALTFTEKAANEMKSRIMDRFEKLNLESARRDLESAYISTIHSFAARVLREHPLEAGVDPDFRMIETEESDFLKEQALDEALEIHCVKGSGGFELLKTYGETRIREGLLKVLDASRHEGRYVAEFLQRVLQPGDSDAGSIRTETEGRLESLGEKDLAREFEAFASRPDWDWKTVEEFRLWRKGFSRKRGSRGDNRWAEIKKLTEELAALKLEGFLGPWKEKFETLALEFERLYEQKKKDRSFLDFDDLQIRALRLFSKDDRVHAALRDRYRRKFRQIMVDEFQDTNQLQMELIEQLAGPDNLFLVGDYKQSIYGFRGAEPSLFLDKEAQYREKKQGVWIPLLENFRTAGSVVDFMNGFFEKLWEEDAVPYQPLLARAEITGEPSTELLVVKPAAGETMERSRMREADAIAARIAELHEKGTPYGDIAVLFQAMTGIGLYEQALKKSGIPYYVLSGGGFYHQPEIRDVVSFLSFLENPLADIPLAASLRSPLFQISDDTLYWLSRRAKGTHPSSQVPAPLYEGVKDHAAIDEISPGEKEKLKAFLDISSGLLQVKDRLKLTELLDAILAKTSYELTVLADSQGVRRYANLKKMINLARELEAVEPLALGAFLRTIRRLENQEVRESEAQIEEEQSGRVVRLLSVHRAKGLEFPVVFVADMGRTSQSPEAKTVLAAPGHGYAMRVRNEITGEDEEPWSWRRLNERAALKEKQELKRLFYVAATRAKQKLILSGVHREKKKEKDSFSEMSSWIDWVIAAGGEGLEIREAGQGVPLKKKRSAAERKDLREIFENFQPQPPEKLIKEPSLLKKAREEGEEILRRIETRPPVPSRVINLPVSAYAAYMKSPAHYRRVYELGYHDSVEEGVDLRAVLKEDDPDPADFGTAVHAVLERIDFRRPDTARIRQLAFEILSGFPEAARKEAADILLRFQKTELFARLGRARKIYRELPFILNERHGMIHGIIDVLFQGEDGAWHVLDYKTAVGDEGKVRSAGYSLQIALYAHAVHEILGQAPASGILYFLKNNWQYAESWTAKSFEASAAAIRELQEKILEAGPQSGGTPG